MLKFYPLGLEGTHHVSCFRLFSEIKELTENQKLMEQKLTLTCEMEISKKKKK